MAMAGEIEVFSKSPEVGKCYKHVEATRSQFINGTRHLYFSGNDPKYVGKFIREKRWGGGGEQIRYIFDDNGTENIVDDSYEGNTCFIEVECKNIGGMRKRSRKIRRKLKTRKHRK